MQLQRLTSGLLGGFARVRTHVTRRTGFPVRVIRRFDCPTYEFDALAHKVQFLVLRLPDRILVLCQTEKAETLVDV